MLLKSFITGLFLELFANGVVRELRRFPLEDFLEFIGVFLKLTGVLIVTEL